MEPVITVFTPTYNREKYLYRIYESLKRQSDRRFKWLIIDDGSTDGTRTAVQGFIAHEKSFEIRCEYKKNGGLHTAYNRALEIADTYLFVCIDSDDFLTDNAISDLLSRLDDIKSPNTAGFIAPNITLDGSLIGGDLPDVEKVHLGELKYKYGHHGDVKMIYKTDVLKRFAPMPEFANEKNFNPCYLFMLADAEYSLQVLHTPVSVIDYSSGGMHTEIFRAYENSPKSYAELRRAFMRDRYAPIRSKFKNAAHYVSSCIFAHEKNMIKKSPCPVITLAAVPLGTALNVIVRIKNKGRT